MHLCICKQINAVEWRYMQNKTYATYKCKKKLQQINAYIVVYTQIDKM